MTIRIISTFALAVMIGLAGCAKKSEPQNEPAAPGAATQMSQSTLLETKWLLTELNGGAIAVDTAREPIYLQLNADGSRVVGFGGCNRLTGSFQISGDTLIFGHMASTKMACPSGEDIEMELLAALEKVWTFAIDADGLALKSEAAIVARFKAAKQ